jgi:hypothetical protein
MSNAALKNFVQFNRPSRPVFQSSVSLGEFLAGGISERISRSQKQLQSLRDFWSSALPPDFLEHLRLAGLKDNVLLVETDSPSYGYELYLRSHELLRQMRELRFPVKRIKFVFGDFVH